MAFGTQWVAGGGRSARGLAGDHNVADFMRAMATAVAAGKVKHVGLSEAIAQGGLPLLSCARCVVHGSGSARAVLGGQSVEKC